MWPIQILRDLKLPKTWGLYQAIDVIDGSTFEMYRSNMQSMVIDMVTEPIWSSSTAVRRTCPVRLEALHPGGEPHVRDRL